MPTPPRTLFQKVWDAHVVTTREDGQALLAIDRHYLHEGSFHSFGMLEHTGRPVLRPDLTFAVADHYVPTTARPAPGLPRPVENPALADMLAQLRANAARHQLDLLDIDDPRQGIVHVAFPEQGLTLPGLTIVCGDSHTSTHGAFGALAFGIGASEVSHVMATQALWQKPPRTLRVTVSGRLEPHVAAKDLILAIIARIGAAGATGHVLEYAGPAIQALGMEARMTLCNMSIEAGGRAGMVAPDDTTFAWLEGRPRAPRGPAWDQALAHWRTLPTDEGAAFDCEVTLDGAATAPTATWGTSPETALPITARIPDPSTEPDPVRRDSLREQLRYMDLRPGAAIEGLAIDQVFIGSCTNGRLSDLEAAAAVLRGRRAAIPGLVVPGSTPVKRAAEAQGLDRVFMDAGLTWGEAGCSMCVGMNHDLVPAGRRCASTSNRNFEGRQGRGARTHLMSPAMAAAAALTGRITRRPPPMTPFTTFTARAAVLDRANVDTDQIIPARFLREPRQPGYGAFLFHDLPDIRAAVLGAGVLLAGDNFGCGSSREGAVYALLDAGIRCVIAPSFGDIFAANAGKNGLLLLTLSAATTAPLVAAGGALTIDLEGQAIRAAGNAGLGFEIDPFRKRMLVEGLDDIGLTLAHRSALDTWARQDASARPWASPAPPG